MKTTRILSIAMTLAMGMIAGLHASVTEHQPPAPLPEFKTPEQLAKWRAETTARTAIQESTSSRLSTQDSSTPFYTGKPYLAESGSYAFKYREYNPEMGRWTTVDPSGFPDGANNRMYAAVPTSQLDNNGLETVNINVSGQQVSLTVSNNGLQVQVDVPGSSKQNQSQDNITVDYSGEVSATISFDPVGIGATVTPKLSSGLSGTVRPNYTGVLYVWAKYSKGTLTEGIGFRTYE